MSIHTHVSGAAMFMLPNCDDLSGMLGAMSMSDVSNATTIRFCTTTIYTASMTS